MELIDLVMRAQVLLGLYLGAALFVPWGRRRPCFALAAVAAAVAVVLRIALAENAQLTGMQLLMVDVCALAALIALGFELGPIHVIFSTTCAYAVQHITSKLSYMLFTALYLHGAPVDNATIAVFLLVANLAVGLPIWRLVSRRLFGPDAAPVEFDSVRTVILGAFFIVAAVCLSWVIEDGFDTSAADYLRDYLALGAFCVLFAVVILLFEFTNCNVKRLQSENSMLEQLLEKDRLQYEEAKASMERLNIRYHDLKQQYTRADAREREELEAEMLAARPRYLTGNTALDVLLTQKAAACEERGIQLVCSVDGELLRGMRSYHVYSLFGNAIDNAMECLAKVADPGRRVVAVDLVRTADMAVARVENYTPEPPRMVDGLPQTTKADASEHGFGVKSIRNVAETYGGSADFLVDGETFCLLVTLPLAELAAA